MKIFFFIAVLILCTADLNASTERSEKEVKIGVFLEDLKDIGKFKRIKNVPDGLFPKNLKDFRARATKSRSEVAKIFVSQKGLLEKYPARMMLGMAHFEFFYMNELRENERVIQNFENKYPNISNRKNIQKIYNLNKARKTMREAVGLSLKDSPEKAVSTFYTMHKLFEQSELSISRLSKDEKNKIKIHKGISSQVAKAKSLAEKKLQNRILEKEFKKEFFKIEKKLSNALRKAEHIKEYELLSSFIVEVNELKNKPSPLNSGYKLANFILSDLKKNNLSKKFSHDLSKAKFDSFTQDQLMILGDITKATKLNKNKKSNEIQLDILNLENGGMPVNRLLDTYRNDLDVKLETLHLQLASAEKMSEWKLSDWANAWKSPIPTKIQEAGIEVSLSPEEIEEVKAQLAMQNFQEIMNVDEFKELVEISSDLEGLQDVVNIDIKSFSFSLDDFAKALGDFRGFDISNYAELTALANAQHGANWSVEEYASAYQGNVDVINLLQSGDISSFDAGAIAREVGTDIQEVADTIAAASAAGVSVDLEAVAQGAGYDSFAAAVEAYNAQYGTNYTVESAKEALGQ